MKPFKLGSRGKEVQDIQERLVTAGFLHDEEGEEQGAGYLGPLTGKAVRAFQQARGLLADGIVGSDTWRELVEATRVLGCRYLYLRDPAFRGDDVRELQRCLNGLGFYTGKEDGIYGPQTAAAVERFQRNSGLVTDGIVGSLTLDSLHRLSRLFKSTSVAPLKEMEEWLPSDSIQGKRVMLDPGHGFPPDPGAVGPEGYQESVAAEELGDRLARLIIEAGAVVIGSRRPGEFVSERDRAVTANDNRVDLILSLHANYSAEPRAQWSSAYYFASGNYQSPHGYRMAHLFQDEMVQRLDRSDCRVHGRAYPLLRETKMPAVILEPAFISNPKEESLLRSSSFQEDIAEVIFNAACRYFMGEKSSAEKHEEEGGPGLEP